MYRTAIFITLLFFFLQGMAQTPKEKIDCSGVVFDKKTDEPLAYASVYKKNTNKGTATNLSGFFKLTNIEVGDTLVISYVGYDNMLIHITNNRAANYYLSPKAKLLNEAVVYANNDFLYKKIIDLKKRKNHQIDSAKTYYYLETNIDGNTVELIEAFFNGEYQGYDTKELYFKNSQIGLKPYKCGDDKYYFVSSETSKIFSKYTLFKKNDDFPSNPIELNKWRLKKHYELKLLSAYKDGASKIYEVSFIPKKEKDKYFGGVVWIDLTNNYIKKIDLTIKNTQKQPFKTFGNINIIKGADIYLSKTFLLKGDNIILTSMNYDIDLTYENYNKHEYSPHIHTYIKPFDYNKKFVPSLFNFGETKYKDYRNASLTSNDSVFWCNREFYLNDSIRNELDFFNENKLSPKHRGIDFSNIANEKNKIGLLQYAFIEWDIRRFIIHEATKNRIEEAAKRNKFNADKYNINTKLYLDINEIHDTVYHITKAILDPIDTYYFFKIDNRCLVFFNIYFDLLEIERRDLEEAISQLKHKDYTSIKQLYYKSMDNYDKTIKLFVKETDRGKNQMGLIKWNKYVYENLMINNLAYFNIVF